MCNQNVTTNSIDSPNEKILQLQICAAYRRISLTYVVLPLNPAHGGNHQQRIPPRSSGCLHKKEVIFFFRMGRRGLWAGGIGHDSYLKQQPLCGRRSDAPGHLHPQGGGEGRARTGTERRGEDGDGDWKVERSSRGEVPRVAWPAASWTPACRRAARC
jgi:hypothetical protein